MCRADMALTQDLLINNLLAEIDALKRRVADLERAVNAARDEDTAIVIHSDTGYRYRLFLETNEALEVVQLRARRVSRQETGG